MRITVHCDKVEERFDHFWESTGFTPAGLLLSDEMKQTLAHVGGLPHKGVKYVRIHYLLQLVKLENLDPDDPVYDWSELDEGLDALVGNGLRPFFELMGTCGGVFDDWTDDTQLRAWRRMVRDLAERYMDRYGREEVEKWYFETWNEPDGWVPWPDKSAKEFANYYDACLQGLLDANQNLTMGGPGTCKHLSDRLKGFLAHCDSGKNCFTGEPVRVDFISVHEKGVRACDEDLNPDTEKLCEMEAEIVDYIREHHPRLADVPFMNNECDPQVGWRHIHTWRARPYYAAWAARSCEAHYQRLAKAKGVPYALVGNDNGFLGTWGMRTHLAKVDGPKDEDDKPAGFDLIKKPVLNVMGLLAMLGDRRCEVSGIGDPAGELGIMATRRGDEQVAVMVYHSRDRIMSSGSRHVDLHLNGVPFDEARLVHYRIDDDRSDPYAVWERMGAPNTRKMPPEAFAEILRREEIEMHEAPRDVAVIDGKVTLSFQQPLPSVSLLLLTTRPDADPPQAGNLRADLYTGSRGDTQVMLRWDATEHRALRTWEILRASSPEGPFERGNEADTLYTSFRDPIPATATSVAYCVRAVDLWGRTGPESDVIEVPLE